LVTSLHHGGSQELEDGIRKAAQQVATALLGASAASLLPQTVKALAVLSEAIAACEAFGDNLGALRGLAAVMDAPVVWLGTA
jgi:hypothetical protein